MLIGDAPVGELPLADFLGPSLSIEDALQRLSERPWELRSWWVRAKPRDSSSSGPTITTVDVDLSTDGHRTFPTDIEETQFLDYKELDSRFMLTDSIIEADEDGEKGPPPEEKDVDDGSPRAKELSDSEFAGALSRLPSQRLVRFIESVSAGKVLPAEPVSKEEFQALFGSET